MTKASTKYKLSPAISLIVDSTKVVSAELSDEERLRKVKQDLVMIAKTLAFRKTELFQIRNLAFTGSHERTIHLRAYFPTENKFNPCLIFFHGGGFLSGSMDTHDTLCRKIAGESNIVVIAVGYNLAPGHKFPAYVEDAEEAIQYIFSHSHELLIDPAKTGIGGDSAGGNLAAVMTHYFKNEPDINFAFQLLLCPAMEIHKMNSPTFKEFNGDFTVSKEDILWGNSLVYNSVEEEKLPESSPIYYPDFSGLPPGLTITAELDIMRYDAELYAEKCRQARVSMQTVRFDGMIHDFFIYGRIIPEATGMTRLVAEQINQLIQ